MCQQQPVAVQQKTRDVWNEGEPEETPNPILDLLNTRIDLLNAVTNEPLTHYILVQSVPDKYAEQVLNIPGQYVTTLAFQDRYGREDSNNNLNVFLQVTHTTNDVTSLRGVQLGGDDVLVFINGVEQSPIVKTEEIPLH